jgi:hypothetical protein
MGFLAHESLANHEGVYQIGDVYARSCSVIGTSGPHLDVEAHSVYALE